MRFTTFIFTALFITGVSHAQDGIGVAKYAGEFMATGFGSRALAMGGAHTAVASDVIAAYWNPAGIMHQKYPEIGLMHEQRFGGLATYNYGGIAWPFGSKSTLALSITRLGVDDIPDTRNALIDRDGDGLPDPNERPDYSQIRYFNAADWAAYLTYAFRGSNHMNLGINLKIIRRDLAEGSAMGVGFDVGAQYRVTDEFLLGATAQDVTTTLIAWSTGTNELVSPTLKLGAAYRVSALGGTVTPALDLDMMFENRQTASTAHLGPVSINPRFGVEYAFRDLFALRAGFNDTKRLTFGAGVHLPKLYLDYAFGQNALSNEGISDGFSDPSHIISVRVVLEEKHFQRPTN